MCDAESMWLIIKEFVWQKQGDPFEGACGGGALTAWVIVTRQTLLQCHDLY